METAYITNSNYIKLLKSLNGYTTQYKFVINEIQESVDKSPLFSPREKQQILLTQNFFLRYNDFYKNNKELIEIQIEENKKSEYYLFSANTASAYHADINCEKLHNNYENYKIDKNIPEIILKEYKEWICKHLLFLKHDLRLFYGMHKIKWGDKFNIPEYVNYENSSTVEIQLDNINELKAELKRTFLEEIEDKDKKDVRNLLKYSGIAFYDESKITSNIIKKYIDFFKNIHRLKSEIIKSLTAYYIAEQKDGCNTEILKKAGFKPCKYCCK